MGQRKLSNYRSLSIRPSQVRQNLESCTVHAFRLKCPLSGGDRGTRKSCLTLTELLILETIGFERQQNPTRSVSSGPGTPLNTSVCTMESVKTQALMILLEFCNDSVRHTVQTFGLLSHPGKLRFRKLTSVYKANSDFALCLKYDQQHIGKCQLVPRKVMCAVV